jgi:hypothetical protein
MKRDTIHHSAFLAVFSTLIVLAGLTRTFAKVDRFTATYFDEMSGLSSNYVNDIEKDDFGFFWLATEKGLVRFDGLNFLEINQQFGLPTLSLTSIERHGNRLSLIFENSSGYIFNLDNHTVLLKMQDPVVDIAWLRQDVLTVLYTSGKIEKLVGYKRVASVTYPWSGATSYLSAANGQLVIGDYYKGVAVLDTGRLSMQATLPLVSDGIKKRPGSNRGDLFFYSNDTLFSLNKDRQLITHGRLSCLPPNTVVTGSSINLQAKPSNCVVVRMADSETVEAGTLLAYPNPTAGDVRVNYEMLEAGKATFMLYDLTGKMVMFREEQHDDAGQYQLELKLTDKYLSNGLYFLRVIRNDRADELRILLTE